MPAERHLTLLDDVLMNSNDEPLSLVNEILQPNLVGKYIR